MQCLVVLVRSKQESDVRLSAYSQQFRDLTTQVLITVPFPTRYSLPHSASTARTLLSAALVEELRVRIERVLNPHLH